MTSITLIADSPQRHQRAAMFANDLIQDVHEQ